MTYQNPFADMMKNFAQQYKAPTMGALPGLDINKIVTSGRRNVEALTAASQVVAESCQTITRRQAELMRAHVEKTLKTAKDMLVNGSPDLNPTKQVEFAKSLLELATDNVREICEMSCKSQFEVFDLLKNRATECTEELSETAKAAAPTNKRKAA